MPLYQILVNLENFSFWDQICPKKTLGLSIRTNSTWEVLVSTILIRRIWGKVTPKKMGEGNTKEENVDVNAISIVCVMAFSSLSNSNYFTLAKKCRRESYVMDFTSAKMEFMLAIFKKLYFSKYSIKRCCKQIISIQKLVWPYKQVLNGVMITGRLSIT